MVLWVELCPTPSNSYVAVLTANVTAFEDKAFRRYLRSNEAKRMGPQSDRTGGLIKEGRVRSHSVMWGHRKKAITCKSGRWSSPEPDHAGALISGFRSLEPKNVDSYCLNHPVYDILLWQSMIRQMEWYFGHLIHIAVITLLWPTAHEIINIPVTSPTVFFTICCNYIWYYI